MKVDHAVAHAFIKEGTSAVFGLLGDSQLAWWAEMAQSGVQLIDARDEGAAVAMADGWARATGKVGVASVTHGPGVSRTATSLITAARYRTPVVIHTGATPFNKEQALQYMDQEKLVSSTGAGYIEVLTPDYAETAVRDAFYRAQVEQRPIVLSIPADVQSKEYASKGEYQPSSKMFRGQQRIRPDADRLQDAVGIIAASKKILIMFGRGATEPECVQTIDRLGKRLGALIAPTLHAKGVLGDSEYYAGIAGQFSSRTLVQFCAEADCVLALGTSMHGYAVTVRGKPLFPNAKIVHIDVAPHLMMGSGKGADCYIQGDAMVTAAAIDDLLQKDGVTTTGFRTADVRKALRDAEVDREEREIEPGTVDPREAARIMDETLPPEVGLVVGDGHYMSFPIMLMRKRRGPHVFSTAFGSIGQALATGIGAAIGLDKPLLCVEGDGGALQNIQELDTAARAGAKLLYVVMNDDAYGAEFHKLKTKKLNPNLSAVRAPDFAAVAHGFGCKGRTAKTPEAVESAVQEFLAGDGPMVLDIKISRNVISIPYRRMHFGEDV